MGRTRSAEQTNRKRAEKLAERALTAADSERALKWAIEALELWPQCADARTVLSEFAPSPLLAAASCEAAMEAALLVAGPDLLREPAGDLWQVKDARPYLRARLSLSRSLWKAGMRDESLGHLVALLELDREDHQGVRYLLAARWLEMGRDRELAPLLERFSEPSAAWTYFQALARFRSAGDSPEARKLLTAARRLNRHVIDRLLGRLDMLHPWEPHEQDSPEAQAHELVEEYGGGWKQTPGAITWLRQVEPRLRRKPHREGPSPVGPVPERKRELRQIEQHFGVAWQVTEQRLPTWVMDEGPPERPRSLLIIEPESGIVVGQNVLTGPTSAEALFDHIAEAIEQPLFGPPLRPSEVQVLESPLWEQVRPHLEEIGVDCIFRQALDDNEDLREHLEQMLLDEPSRTAFMTIPGVRPEQVGRLFDAAAEFYRAAPWRGRLPEEAVIRVTFPRLRKQQRGPWYAGVMGQNNTIIGLGLYGSLDSVRALWDSAETDRPELEQTWSVQFCEAFEIPIADLIEQERRGWPVGGPEAYPLFASAARHRGPHPIRLWLLPILEACLRGVARFVAGHELIRDPVRETLNVPTSEGEVEMQLDWSLELTPAGGDCADCDDECGDECGHHP